MQTSLLASTKSTRKLWDEVIGHDLQKNLLDKIVASNKIPHALLFCGPEAVGKSFSARAFAAELLTRKVASEDIDPQHLVTCGNHPDLHYLGLEEGKKDISVEGIRNLCNDLRLSPYYGTAKVAIIEDAHRMSIAGANALLMTLEEPTNNSFIILCTHAPHRLPATIISRCQQINFGQLSDEQALSILKNIFSEIIEDAEIKALAEICDGSLSSLSLDSFVDKKTKRLLKDNEQLVEYLKSLRKAVSQLESDIQRIGTNQPGMDYTLRFAERIVDSENEKEIFWHLLRKYIRKQLQSEKTKKYTAWSDLLTDSLKTEQLIKERNANAHLQLSSLLIKLAGI